MTPTAQQILQFCSTEYGTIVADQPGEVNIVYLEGATVTKKEDALSTITPNNDAPDLWNDVRMVISPNQFGEPNFKLLADATSEPGLSATHSKRAQQTNGVFRIAIGYHHEKWRAGFHKGNLNHPALVQAAPILGTRDRNRDGKRTGDLVTDNVKGLNQHGTRPGLTSMRVGEWSYACLVARIWAEHIKFMKLNQADPRYLKSVEFLYSTTVVDYSRFWAWFLTQK